MNRWELYGMLKRGIRLYDFDEKELEEKIYKMDITELREAVMEYLLMIKDNHNFNLYAGYEQQKGSGKHE